MPDYIVRRIYRSTNQFMEFMRASLKPSLIFAFVAGISYFAYDRFKPNETSTTNKKKSSMIYHERRFRNFASIDVDGIIFMTPVDFLQSLISDQSKIKKRISMDGSDVERILRNTPGKSKNSPKLFRHLQNEGLISYSDYIFLLQILTKPQSGFEIAFKMLDINMNGSIDADEFAVMNHALTKTATVKLEDNTSSSNSHSDLVMTGKRAFNTTLMVHLFGQNRTTQLSHTEFIRFMKNVQFEALEVEFNAHAFIDSFISNEDFAHILLRHAQVTHHDYDAFIERLRSRTSHTTKVSFSEFKKFFNFMNSLDDFILAVKMYSIASRPLSKSEFLQAAKACTGDVLCTEIIDTVFALFDVNGDGMLISEEFIHVLQNRKSRCSNVPMNRYDGYKRCIQNEMNKPFS